ncbi:sulfur carrier protein ThiS [Staphylococcus hyicus]|nr:sulfur carrier protein ThiS [Staphylococcus hyicus]
MVNTKEVSLMSLNINGDAFEIDRLMTIAELIECLEIEGKRIAIELNGQVIKRSLWPTYTLSDNDQIEILEFVGGG